MSRDMRGNLRKEVKRDPNKNLTSLVMILDKSGSMYGLTDDTIGGFNSMIEKQKKEAGDAVVTTVLFNDRVEFLHNRVPINRVKPMTHRQYEAGGSTSLLDAIGIAVEREISNQRHLPVMERADKVVFVIITDGYENSSSEYSYRTIKHILDREQKEFGWEFLFLGANIDAVSEGAKLGIRKDRSVNYMHDGIGTGICYESVSAAVGCIRNTMELGAEWKEAVEKDMKKRGRKK